MLGSSEPDGGASGEEDNDTEKEGPTFLKVNVEGRMSEDATCRLIKIPGEKLRGECGCKRY